MRPVSPLFSADGIYVKRGAQGEEEENGMPSRSPRESLLNDARARRMHMCAHKRYLLSFRSIRRATFSRRGTPDFAPRRNLRHISSLSCAARPRDIHIPSYVSTYQRYTDPRFIRLRSFSNTSPPRRLCVRARNYARSIPSQFRSYISPCITACAINIKSFRDLRPATYGERRRKIKA